MTKTTKAKTAPTTATKSVPAAKLPIGSFVVFGADQFAKPRAALFTDANSELLAKAVEAMHLRMFEAKGELAKIAKRLPVGRLHAKDRDLVPFVPGDLYQEVVTETAGEQQPPPATPAKLPRHWDDLAPGHLVIAWESRECGWWEAIVIERKGDLVTLRFRDYPRYPPLVRHRSAVALIGAPAQ